MTTTAPYSPIARLWQTLKKIPWFLHFLISKFDTAILWWRDEMLYRILRTYINFSTWINQISKLSLSRHRFLYKSINITLLESSCCQVDVPFLPYQWKQIPFFSLWMVYKKWTNCIFVTSESHSVSQSIYLSAIPLYMIHYTAICLQLLWANSYVSSEIKLWEVEERIHKISPDSISLFPLLQFF